MKSVIKNIYKLFPLAAMLPKITLAQGPIDSGLNRINRQGLFSNQGLSGSRSVSEFLAIIIEYMLIFAGIIAVMFIIVGGYWYITAAGNEEQAEKGKTALVNAIIGVIVIILSYVIVRVVTNLVGNDVL